MTSDCWVLKFLLLTGMSLPVRWDLLQKCWSHRNLTDLNNYPYCRIPEKCSVPRLDRFSRQSYWAEVSYFKVDIRTDDGSWFLIVVIWEYNGLCLTSSRELVNTVSSGERKPTNQPHPIFLGVPPPPGICNYLGPFISSGTPPKGHLVDTVASLLRPISFVLVKRPYIFS